jgi:hypothetical protein
MVAGGRGSVGGRAAGAAGLVALGSGVAALVAEPVGAEVGVQVVGPPTKQPRQRGRWVGPARPDIELLAGLGVAGQDRVAVADDGGELDLRQAATIGKIGRMGRRGMNCCPGPFGRLQPCPAKVRTLQPRLAEDRPLQPRPAEDRPLQPREAEVRPLQPREAEARPLQPRVVELRPLQPREGEVRPLQPRLAEDRPLQPRPEEVRPLQPRVVEVRPLQPRVVEVRPLQPRPSPDYASRLAGVA